jgi:GT2 family glycosyltransferase
MLGDRADRPARESAQVAALPAPAGPGSRYRRGVATGAPSITAVVVTWRGERHIAACLDSLLAQGDPASILVIDNASDDGTAQILGRYAADHAAIRVVRMARNLGFAGGVAAALDHVWTEFVALLNDDATADPGWLGALRRALEHRPAAAAATSQVLLASSGMINNAGVALTNSGYGYDIGFGDPPARHAHSREVFGFYGGAALLRTDALRAVGGFPARFFLYYEDTDTSWRLQLAGWSVVYEPSARVVHQHGASAGPASRTFAYHNERNRLWMLIRCAPAGVALRELGRFPLTTASLAAQAAARRRPAGPQFSIRLRLAAIASTLWQLIPLLRQRRAAAASAANRRQAWTTARWTGGRHTAGWPVGPFAAGGCASGFRRVVLGGT